MTTKKLMFMICLILVGSGSILFVTGCRNQQQKHEQESTQKNQPEAGWMSMFDGESLSGWEITSFGTEGPVRISEGNIVLGMGDGCTGITWKGDFPTVNYEIKLDAKKVSGNDFFCGITFPVKDSFCSLIVGGWGGPVTGLSCIDGHDASENETTVLKKFEHDTWYQIHLKVTAETIEAWINQEQIIDFSAINRKLTVRPEVELSRPFGICSWITTAALCNIRIKNLTDEGNASLNTYH
jgi:hypothetical protein